MSRPLHRDRAVTGWVAAGTASHLGDAAWLVALAWTAVHSLSPAAAGLVLGIGTLPQALLTLAGGVLADRYDPRRIVVAGEAARALVLVGGAVGWQLGLPPVALLPGLAVALGTAAGLTQPALQTMPRLIAEGDELRSVSGWTQIGSRLARLSGAPLGAWLVVASGPAGAMVLDAATFAVVAVTAGRLRARFTHPRSDARPSDALREGLHHLRVMPRTRMLVLGICGLNVFTVPALTLGVPLRVSTAGWSAGWLGAAEAGFAVGAILGSATALRWRPESLAAAGFTVLVGQGGAIILVSVPSTATLLLATVAIGLTAGLASVWVSAAFIATVEPAFLGRVSSVTTLGDLALLPLATPFFGLVAGSAGLAAALGLYGVAMAGLCLVLATRRAFLEPQALSTPDPSSSSVAEPSSTR